MGTLQPTVLVAFEAKVVDLFDARSNEALLARGTSAAALAADDWRERMRKDGIAPTQRFAADLAAEGFSGLLVPSYVRGASSTDTNLVLFRWGAGTGAQLTLIDDENRLG